MDNVKARFSGATFFDNVSGDASRGGAVQQLYGDLGRNGLVWMDGHPGNMAFANVGGTLQAIIVAQDMIFQAKEWSSMDFIQRNSANLGVVQRLPRLFDDRSPLSSPGIRVRSMPWNDAVAVPDALRHHETVNTASAVESEPAKSAIVPARAVQASYSCLRIWRKTSASSASTRLRSPSIHSARCAELWKVTP